MKIKVLPVPASKIQRQSETGGITSAEWTDNLLRNLTGTAAAQLGVPAQNVQVEMSASLATGLQLPAPTLQQQPTASQAMAEFLEAISSPGSPSVLVGVDLVRPAGDMMGPAPASSNASSNAAVIAIGSISGVGDVTQSLRIANAMQRQCPELFIRGTAFTAADSACAALLAARYLPALAGPDGSPATAAPSNTSSGTLVGLATNTTAANSTISNSTASNSTADSSTGRASFTVRVVMPVALNIKLSVAVRAAPGHDAESLYAAAHVWLASQDFQQLLEDQGLQTGRGTPARLVAVMPQPGGSSGRPAADHDEDDKPVSGAGSSAYNKESGWFIPWKPGHGSSHHSGSGAAPGPQEGVPQQPPVIAGSAAGDRPDGWVELSSQAHNQGKKKDQSMGVIVGGLLAATVLGVGIALGAVAVFRRRRRMTAQQGKGSSSDTHKASDGTGGSKGGSTAERRARRRTRSSRGIGKRYLKYLPSNLTPSNLAAVAPPLLAGQASGGSAATSLAVPAAATECLSMQRLVAGTILASAQAA
ncbi:hypothetical protein OEZ86_003434 [Tetradesmus obliquus]|nr:hypothetical protein OEZ86_003434 [Tetradesmus obliquus]